MAGTTNTSHSLDADVVVVGCGFGGLILACALGNASINVIALDEHNEQHYGKNSLGKKPDERTTAIARASWQELRRWGVTDSLESHACPIERIRVTDRSLAPPLDFFSEEVGEETGKRNKDGQPTCPQPMGWIVPNAVLRAALLQRLASLPNVTVMHGARLSGIEQDDAQARAILADGRAFTCMLVAGADGRRSLCRDLMGIESWSYDYKQTAIVCNVTHPFPHDNIAIEKFRASGPFAVLPMTGQRSSIVWCESPETAAYLKNLSDQDFLYALEKQIGDWLGRPLQLDSARGFWPLNLSRARHFIAKRGVLISEAAHGIHPIAGQGLNIGIRNIAALERTIVKARNLGLDIGSKHVLAEYEKTRRSDTGAFVIGMDMLVHIFGSTFTPLRAARRMAMGIVGKSGTLRRAFMKVAMGSRI